MPAAKGKGGAKRSPESGGAEAKTDKQVAAEAAEAEQEAKAAEAAKAFPDDPEATVDVEVTQPGFIRGRQQEVGAVLKGLPTAQFSKRWMKPFEEPFEEPAEETPQPE